VRERGIATAFALHLGLKLRVAALYLYLLFWPGCEMQCLALVHAVLQPHASHCLRAEDGWGDAMFEVAQQHKNDVSCEFSASALLSRD
jgi:hypothetical protein